MSRARRSFTAAGCGSLRLYIRDCKIDIQICPGISAKPYTMLKHGCMDTFEELYSKDERGEYTSPFRNRI
jgi:hypothetical protein